MAMLLRAGSVARQRLAGQWAAAPAACTHAARAAFSAGPDTGATEEVDGELPVAEVEEFRKAYNFRRRTDGRVQVRSPSGAWLDLKLDGRVEGSLLFREPPAGHVYYLVSEDLKQIDLSNDMLVARLFGDGGWDEVKQPLMAPVPGSKDLAHVKLSPSQFKAIFTLLKEGSGVLPGPSPP